MRRTAQSPGRWKLRSARPGSVSLRSPWFPDPSCVDTFPGKPLGSGVATAVGGRSGFSTGAPPHRGENDQADRPFGERPARRCCGARAGTLGLFGRAGSSGRSRAGAGTSVAAPASVAPRRGWVLHDRAPHRFQRATPLRPIMRGIRSPRPPRCRLGIAPTWHRPTWHCHDLAFPRPGPRSDPPHHRRRDGGTGYRLQPAL